MAVAFSPDGQSVVSSGMESALFWWDPKTGKRIRQQGGHGRPVHEICFSPDGKRLASASSDMTVRLWDGATGKPLQTLNVGCVAYAVAISPDGKQVAVGGFDGLVSLWDALAGKQLATLLSLPPDTHGEDWLALTPSGFLDTSHALVNVGRWRIGSREVRSNEIWPVLARPERVAQAIRGEKVSPPIWPATDGAKNVRKGTP
jgi:WD40 repeat protein